MDDYEKNPIERLIAAFLLVRMNGKVVSDGEVEGSGRQIVWGLGNLRAWRNDEVCGVHSVDDENHDSHLILRLDHVAAWRVADRLFEEAYMGGTSGEQG